eukprot:gene13302-15719_t
MSWRLWIETAGLKSSSLRGPAPASANPRDFYDFEDERSVKPTADKISEAEQSKIDITRRFKTRMWDEIAQAAMKEGHTKEDILARCEMLDTLLLDFTPNLDKLSPKKFVELAVDASAVGRRIAVLKSHFPGIDIPQLWLDRPSTFLESEKELDESALKLKDLLSKAKDINSIITVLPMMINIEYTVSILVTMKNRFPTVDPVEELEKDPDYILRSQANGQPLDPVFFDGESWSAPSFDRSSSNLNLEWQRNLRKKQKEEEEEFWRLERLKKEKKENDTKTSFLDK